MDTAYIQGLIHKGSTWSKWWFGRSFYTSCLLTVVFYLIYFTFMDSGAVRYLSIRSVALCHFITLRRIRLWNTPERRLNLNPTLVCVPNVFPLWKAETYFIHVLFLVWFLSLSIVILSCVCAVSYHSFLTIFHCIDTLQFVYPFTCLWTFGLFLVWGCYP